MTGRTARVVDRLDDWARDAPDAIAYRDASRTLGFAAAAAATQRLARWLRRLGLDCGERLLIVAENDVATPLLLLAAQRLGAWPAIVNARCGAAELAAMCDCASPRLLLFCCGGSESALRLARQALARSIDDPDCGRLAVASAVPASPGDPGLPAGLLLFTSGTTGKAKAVIWSHAGLLELGRVLAASRATGFGAMVQCAAPLSHIMGISNFMAALQAGATLRLMPRLDSAALVEAIAAGEVTHLSLVPTAYLRLCDHLEAEGRTLAGCGLRYVSSGGAPLDAALKARVERLLGLRLVNGYGMTECAPVSRTRPDCDAPAHCIGWPEAGVELRMDAAPGAVGELLVRSATRMLGYFGQPGETAAALRDDGWLATGDLAEQRPDGSFCIVGRCKEMIIRSGFNVYPAEVEAALNAHPAVRQSAVLGRRLADGNEEVFAFVQRRHGDATSAEAILREVAPQLAPYKRPTHLVLMDELPLGATGKVAKPVLRALLPTD